MTTVRALLAVAALRGWHLCQMDVSNAFLHGDINEEVYMVMPKGYRGQGERIQPEVSSTAVSKPQGSKPPLVCRLLKSSYGLKQAPRQWFAELSTALLSFRFTQSKVDYSLFTMQQDGSFIAILIYVDDMIITGNDMKLIQKMKHLLSSQFHMKELGELRYFLGLEIARSKQGLFVSQQKYVTGLLKEFQVSEGKACKLPLDQHLKLKINDWVLLADPKHYRLLIGKLIYLTITRPDISFAVQVLSQFMNAPTDIHMSAADHVLRYLKQSLSQGILMAHSSAAHLTAFCDADWASCPNSRRSTSGFCILLGTSPVSWKSKKQSVVARSSAEAKYRSMAITTCEVTWLVNLLKDLGLKKLPPVDMKCDNQAALYIAANPVFHERTKHIEVDHFVRDKVKESLIKPSYVPTRWQLADILTKVPSVDQHHRLLSKMVVQSSPHSLKKDVLPRHM